LYELMFDSTTKRRLIDAADLLIDFATLGEYGLEAVGRTAEACEARLRPRAEGTQPALQRRKAAQGRPF
jgi:hypothetical protein